MYSTTSYSGISNYSSNQYSPVHSINQQQRFETIPQYQPEKITIYKAPAKTYELPNKDYSNDQRNLEVEHMIFAPKTFLQPERPKTKTITENDNIEELVQETFYKLTGEQLPKNLKIRIFNKHEFMMEHARFGGAWSEGVMGFAVHSTNQIFIREAQLDELMIVLGHEIGHLMSNKLPEIIDEEAKAMAFERAWAQTIVDNNIGNLKNNILIPEKAHNGIHNVADNFVDKVMNLESTALNAFEKLARREIRHSNNFGMILSI